jgi:enoyl-CoA hydratase/carnithine racemase
MASITTYHGFSCRSIAISTLPEREQLPARIILVTLARPEKHNSFTDRMAAEMAFAFELFDSDDSVKAVVVTGAGKTFCTGADLDSKDHRDE